MDVRDRGTHAQRLIEDEVLQDAFDGVKEYHTKAMLLPSATNDEVLDARRAILALDKVQQRLRTFIAEGKRAQKKDQDRGHD